jgi:hypothetical protein
LLDVDIELLHRLLYDAHLIAVIVNHKPTIDPYLAAMNPEYAGRERVERSHGYPAGPVANEMLDALPHFTGGLVGKGKRQDVPGSDASLLYEVGDACGQHAGLPATWSGDDQHRSVNGGHGRGLFGVESREQCHGFIYADGVWHTLPLRHLSQLSMVDAGLNVASIVLQDVMKTGREARLIFVGAK